jgi:hypothetical protein
MSKNSSFFSEKIIPRGSSEELNTVEFNTVEFNTVELNTSIFQNALKNALALLIRERSLLLPLTIVLMLPLFLKDFFTSDSVSYHFILSGIVYCIEMLLTYSLTIRVFNKYTNYNVKYELRSFLVFTLFGFSFFAGFTLPTLAADMINISGIKFLAALIVGTVFILTLVLHFYFIPVILQVGGIANSIEFAKRYTAGNIFLPLKFIIPPITVSLLFQAVLFTCSPDGRLLLSELIENFLYSAQKLFIIYLNISFGITYLKLNTISLKYVHITFLPILFSMMSSGNETLLPNFYLQKNYQIIEKCFMTLFSPKVWTSLIIITMVLWGFSLDRLQTIHPPGSITFSNATVEGSNIKVTIIVHDQKYKLRALNPKAFSLASEKNTPLESTIENITVGGINHAIGSKLPVTDKALKINIVYTTTRTENDLKRLTDIFLWYRRVKLFRVVHDL